ncbi:MAG: ABC transporter permease [Erysipelothrix sp.]|nr:ABC transporter permease [Erysipelothrix sp.]
MLKIKQTFNDKLAFPLLAVVVGFVVAAIILALTGYNPLEVYSILFAGMFSKPRYLVIIILKAAPIILTGVSVAFALKVGLFNIGAEGQFLTGSVFATIFGLTFDFPALIQFPLVLLAGVCGGALYGALAGYLKAKRGINEVITGIMLNWTDFYFSNWITSLEKFREAGTTSTYILNKGGLDPIFNWKMSESGRSILANNSFLNEIIGRTNINVAIIFAVVVAIVISYLLNHTTKGYELRAVGLNAHAAKASGINVSQNTILTLAISGAIAGLAGALLVSGDSQRLHELMALENYGFNGLSVALMAGGSPIGSILSGLLFAGLSYGGSAIQLKIGAPSEIIDILIGTIVFFMALVTLLPLLKEKLKRKGTDENVG